MRLASGPHPKVLTLHPFQVWLIPARPAPGSCGSQERAREWTGGGRAPAEVPHRDERTGHLLWGLWDSGDNTSCAWNKYTLDHNAHNAWPSSPPFYVLCLFISTESRNACPGRMQKRRVKKFLFSSWEPRPSRKPSKLPAAWHLLAAPQPVSSFLPFLQALMGARLAEDEGHSADP